MSEEFADKELVSRFPDTARENMKISYTVNTNTEYTERREEKM